jgi:hypothetical protein
VNDGYAAHLDSWKNKEGVLEILGAMIGNKTARTIILRNLFNADARKRISDGRRF